MVGAEAGHDGQDAARGESAAYRCANPRRSLRAGGCVAQRLDREHLRRTARRNECGRDGNHGSDEHARPDRASVDLHGGRRKAETERADESVEAFRDPDADGDPEG